MKLSDHPSLRGLAKTCRTCGVTKALSEFQKTPGLTTDGYRHTCRDCQNVKRRARMKAKRELGDAA